MTDVLAQLKAAAARNVYLHSLLPTGLSELSDDQLADIEMITLEIQANIDTQQALLAQMSGES